MLEVLAAAVVIQAVVPASAPVKEVGEQLRAAAVTAGCKPRDPYAGTKSELQARLLMRLITEARTFEIIVECELGEPGGDK
jgi:hypothetical protein